MVVGTQKFKGVLGLLGFVFISVWGFDREISSLGFSAEDFRCEIEWGCRYLDQATKPSIPNAKLQSSLQNANPTL